MFQETAINPLITNIMEAVIEDENHGLLDNANTGEILAKYVQTPEYDNRTGSGPCQFSSKFNYPNQTMECSMPLPLKWADLYSTWNLAFVSNFPDFVYYLPKLLIPSVSGYQNNPASYLWSRVLALYTYIHWTMNWNIYYDFERIQWKQDSITQNWGSANKKSKDDYVEMLADAMSTTAKEIESKPRPNLYISLAQFALDSILLPLSREGPYKVL